MKKVILFSLLSLAAFAQKLSPQATISIITVSSGSELYSIFGHTEVRVEDPILGIDQVYNYGVFNFNAPFFYLKYLRGTLDYQTISYPTAYDLRSWAEDKRSAYAQELNLNQSQKQRVFDALQNDLKEENKYYKYRFINNNCATKELALLKNTLGDSLRFSKNLNSQFSARKWIDSCAAKPLPWADLGMDLVIGQPVDKILNAEEAQFLPMNMAAALDSAKILHANNPQKMVLKKYYLVQFEETTTTDSLSPKMVFWLIFIFGLMLTAYQFFMKKHHYTFDRIVFGLAGLVGWLIVFLWFLTEHAETKLNMNIIWAFPLLIIVPFILKYHFSRQWYAKYFFAYGMIVLLLLLFQFATPQKVEKDIIPVLLLLALRAFYVWASLRTKIKA